MSNLLRAILSLNDPGWGRSRNSPPSPKADDDNTRPANGARDDNASRPDTQANRPQGPQDGPPDLDELWRDFNRKLSNFFGKGGNPPPTNGAPRAPGGGGFKNAGIGLGVLAAAVLLLWLASGFFIVQEGQTALILRFGKYVRLIDTAGPTWRLPYPIETAEVINTQQLRTVEVGYRQTPKNKLEREAQMLTRDQSIVDMQVAVQYRISDAQAYFFNNNTGGNPEELARQAAEAAMREIVGRRTIDQVLYEEKEGVAKDARELMQKIVDRYRSGITVSDVTVQQAQPPEKVQAAFEDANKAAQDRENLINEGRSYANDVIPKASGTAARLIQEAEGYKQGAEATATGDTARFKSILTEYSKAPQVTRERMYIETMQTIFSNTSKVYVDSKSGTNLLNLPLDRLIGSVIEAPKTVVAPAAPASLPSVPATDPRGDLSESRRDALRSRERDASR